MYILIPGDLNNLRLLQKSFFRVKNNFKSYVCIFGWGDILGGQCSG